MVLLIGGAYQGKAAYARDVLGLAEDGVARVNVQALMEAPEGETAALEALCEAYADGALLLEDISCGVVPVDARERALREASGRFGAYLARRAARVIRVFCGMGMVLKDA